MHPATHPIGKHGFYEKVGMAAWLMTKSKEYAQYPTACLAAWIEPAILHDHIRFFHGEDGKPVGYFTWACLAPDVEQRLLQDPDFLLHISEWNEGHSLWLMDMVLIDGDIRERIREVRTIFSGFAEAKSLRRREDGSVRKVVVWKRTRPAGK